MIRAILTYIQKKAKDSGNSVVQYIACCCACCFWCLENVIRFINKNAYVQVSERKLQTATANRHTFVRSISFVEVAPLFFRCRIRPSSCAARCAGPAVHPRYGADMRIQCAPSGLPCRCVPSPRSRSSYLPLRSCSMCSLSLSIVTLQTAIFSTNFCTSAKNAFFLIARNIARVAAVSVLGEFVLNVMTVHKHTRQQAFGHRRRLLLLHREPRTCAWLALTLAHGRKSHCACS